MNGEITKMIILCKCLTFVFMFFSRRCCSLTRRKFQKNDAENWKLLTIPPLSILMLKKTKYFRFHSFLFWILSLRILSSWKLLFYRVFQLFALFYVWSRINTKLFLTRRSIFSVKIFIFFDYELFNFIPIFYGHSEL